MRVRQSLERGVFKLQFLAWYYFDRTVVIYLKYIPASGDFFV